MYCAASALPRYLLYQRGAQSVYNRRQFLSPGSEIYLGNFQHFFGFFGHQNFNVYYKCIDSHSSLWYSSSHSSHAKNSIPFHSFSYFVAYIVKTDFSEKLGAMCQFFDDMAILLLSFKRAIPAPNKLIDSQHYQRLRRKILIAFHSLSHLQQNQNKHYPCI